MSSIISGSTINTIQSILKDDYKGPINEMLNHKILLMHRLNQTSEFTRGKRSFVPLHTKRNQGLGSRKEASSSSTTNLPAAGRQGYDEAVYGSAYHYAAVEFTGPAIAAARDAEGSFARLVESEVEGAMLDAQRDMNRQLFQGKSGKLATIVSLPGSINTIDGLVNAALEYEVDDIRHFAIDQVLDIIDASSLGTKLNSTNIVVTAIDNSNNTITTTGTAAGVAVTDFFTRENNYGAEMFGLEDIVSNLNPASIAVGEPTTSRFVGSIDRTSAPKSFWKSKIFDKSNTVFGDKIFRDMLNEVERFSQGSLSIFITTYEIYDAYGTQLLVDRRYQTQGTMFQKLDGGFEFLDYNGVPVVKERDAQNGVIYGLDESSLLILVQSDWDWMDKDGSMLARVPGKDAYGGTLFSYKELATRAANRNTKAVNVAV